MNYFVSSVKAFACILLFAQSPAFASYLTLEIKGENKNGPFGVTISPEDIQKDKSKQIPLGTGDTSGSIYLRNGEFVSFDIPEHGGIFDIKPNWLGKLDGFKLFNVTFDMYVDNDPNDRVPGYEIPIKVHYYDATLFALNSTNTNPLKLEFTPYDFSDPRLTSSTFSISAVPEPAAIWMFVSGLLCLLAVRKKVTS